MTEKAPKPESTSDRVVSLVMGVLFAGLGVAVFVLAEGTNRVGVGLAAFALGLLGVEAVVAAWRARPSLLSRIGPLP